MKKRGCDRSGQLLKISRTIPIIDSSIIGMVRLIFKRATFGTPFIQFLGDVIDFYHIT